MLFVADVCFTIVSKKMAILSDLGFFYAQSHHTLGMCCGNVTPIKPGAGYEVQMSTTSRIIGSYPRRVSRFGSK